MGQHAGAMIAVAIAVALAFCSGCSVGASSPTSSTAEASVPSVPADVGATADVKDATYEIDVSLKGGTGKATIESPARLVVADGTMMATIVWSSPNYDQMLVDGAQFFPLSGAGESSVFEIPVSALDEDLPVQAETTAMSEPHMIDYTLRFDSGSMAKVTIDAAA